MVRLPVSPKPPSPVGDAKGRTDASPEQSVLVVLALCHALAALQRPVKAHSRGAVTRCNSREARAVGQRSHNWSAWSLRCGLPRSEELLVAASRRSERGKRGRAGGPGPSRACWQRHALVRRRVPGAVFLLAHVERGRGRGRRDREFALREASTLRRTRTSQSSRRTFRPTRTIRTIGGLTMSRPVQSLMCPRRRRPPLPPRRRQFRCRPRRQHPHQRHRHRLHLRRPPPCLAVELRPPTVVPPH